MFLGDFLIRRGTINSTQRARALLAQAVESVEGVSRIPLGQVLVRLRYVSFSDMSMALEEFRKSGQSSRVEIRGSAMTDELRELRQIVDAWPQLVHDGRPGILELVTECAFELNELAVDCSLQGRFALAGLLKAAAERAESAVLLPAPGTSLDAGSVNRAGAAIVEALEQVRARLQGEPAAALNDLPCLRMLLSPTPSPASRTSAEIPLYAE